MFETAGIEAALAAVGELLTVERCEVALVVVGGASLNLLGLVERTTRDVDVIARAEQGPGALRLRPPDPLPAPLVRAVATVARDFSLPAHWLNTDVARQWLTGLPPWLPADVRWRTFGALRVGLAGRQTLVALKLFAATDGGPRSVHLADLLRLAPGDAELNSAAAWVRTQDASPEFSALLDQVVQLVRDRSR